MFRVTIEEIVEETAVSREWVTLREPYPSEDKMWNNGTERDDKDPQRGYRNTERTIQKTTKMFEQVRENLDMTGVIKAVNGI